MDWFFPEKLFDGLLQNIYHVNYIKFYFSGHFQQFFRLKVFNTVDFIEFVEFSRKHLDSCFLKRKIHHPFKWIQLIE